MKFVEILSHLKGCCRRYFFVKGRLSFFSSGVVTLILLFAGVSIAVAAYTGPNRTVLTSSVWKGKGCTLIFAGSIPVSECPDYGLSCSDNYGIYIEHVDYVSPEDSCPVHTNEEALGWAQTEYGISLPADCFTNTDNTTQVVCSFRNNIPYASGENTYIFTCPDYYTGSGCTRIDTYTPLPPATVSGLLDCSAEGDNGWCAGVGTLELDSTEPMSGQTITSIETADETLCSSGSCSYTFPQGESSLTYWAVSSYGDTSIAVTSFMSVDSVAPTANLSITGSLNNGWYNSGSPLIFTTTGSDETSGVESELVFVAGDAAVDSPVTYSGSDTSSLTVQGQVLDLAGNSEMTSIQTIKIDFTPPLLSPSIISGSLGINGYYVTSVTVGATASDALSGLDTLSPSENVTFSTDGTHSQEFSAADVAGNTSTDSITVMIDTTKPTASPSILSGALGLSGWYVSSVVVSANADDATSGIDTISPSSSVTLDDQGSNTATFLVTDRAGNSDTFILSGINIDTVPPSMSPTITGTLGLSNWYTSAVTVRGHASDDTSGVLVDPVQTFSVDGIYDPVSLTAQDVAGNENTVTLAEPVKVDTTAPSISPTITGTAGNNGWYITGVTVVQNATDDTSGVLSAPSLDFTDGIHESVVLTAQDVAGNTRTVELVDPVKVDTVQPLISPTVLGTLGSNGWYVSSVTLQTNATDESSGIASSDAVVLTDGVHSDVILTAEDNAGNTRSVTLADTYSVDTVVPEIVFNALPVVTGPVTISGSAQDTTSGLDTFELSINGGLTWDTVTVNPDGTWSVPDVNLVFVAHQALIVGRATDMAGNVSTRNLVAQSPTPTSPPRNDDPQPTPSPTSTVVYATSTPTAMPVVEITSTLASTPMPPESPRLSTPTSVAYTLVESTPDPRGDKSGVPIGTVIPIAVTGAAGMGGLAFLGSKYKWWESVIGFVGVLLFRRKDK